MDPETTEITHQVLTRVDELATQLGTTTTYLFEQISSKIFIENIAYSIITSILLLVSLSGTIITSVLMAKDKNFEWECCWKTPAILTFGLFAITMLLITAFILPDIVGNILYPDAAATEQIIELLRSIP